MLGSPSGKPFRAITALPARTKNGHHSVRSQQKHYFHQGIGDVFSQETYRADAPFVSLPSNRATLPVVAPDNAVNEICRSAATVFATSGN